MKNKNLFYPSNLNIKEVINEDEILTTEQKKVCIKYYQRVLYPVHKIIFDLTFNKTYEDEKYVKLNATILDKIFGKPLKGINVIAFLLRQNIIIKNKLNYSPTNHSNSYTLDNQYINEYYSKEYITDNTLCYHLINNKSVKSNQIDNQTIEFIKANLKELNIDLIKAKYLLFRKIKEIKKQKNQINNNIIYNYSLPIPYVRTFSTEGVTEPLFEEKTDYLTKDFINNYFTELKDLFQLETDNEVKEVIKCWDMNISMMDSKDWFTSKSTTSGRIFNNITSLPRELRHCLYNNDGEQLTELDISNSQPFLFTKLIKENFNLDKDIFLDKYEDIRHYIQLTEDGLLYDYLIKKWNITTDRNQFKKQFFGKVFYCKSSSNERYLYSKLFKQEFPNVFNLILKLKEGNYKNLAIQLQKRESDLIIYKVGKVLMDRKIWFVTVHDSIICKQSNSIEVKEIMDKIFNKNNLHPTIKIKNL